MDTGSLFWGADAGTWFQRFFTGDFFPCFSGTLQCRRQRTVHDGGDQLRGQPAVFKCWRENDGHLWPEKGGHGNAGNLDGGGFIKCSDGFLSDDPVIHVPGSWGVHHVKYYRESVNAHDLCRICGNDGQYLFLYSGNRHQRKPVFTGKIRVQLWRLENDQWRAFCGRAGEPGFVCHGEFETRKRKDKT